jgi:uncharacterized membrane protein
MTLSRSRPRSGDRPAQRFFNNARRINVGGGERLASVLGGGALAIYGLSRRAPAGLLLSAVGAALVYRGMTGHCQMYETLGMTSVNHRPRTSIPSGQGIKVEESVTVLRPRDELFNFWRRLEHLPRVMQHLVCVEEKEDKRSHWIAVGLTGNIEWDAEIITERPNELIGWRSLDGSTVDTAGSVHFQDAPGGQGTEVKVVLSYNPPGGRLAATIAWLGGRDPQTEIREDLRYFKRIMEAGTAPTTEGQPRGKCA